MAEKGTSVNDVRQELRALGMEAHDELLKLHGIDPEKAHAIAKRLNSRYSALVAKAEAAVEGVGKDVAKVHAWSYQRTIRQLQQQQVQAVAAMTAGGVFNLTRLPDCIPLGSAALDDHGEFKDPAAAPAVADVTYEAGSVAHPYVCVDNQDAGAFSTATATVWFDFTFNPGATGYYCIRPLVYANGLWSLFAWNTGGCGGPSSAGSGAAQAVLRVSVGQDMHEVSRGPDLDIIDPPIVGSAPQHEESSFTYDSEVTGGASLVAPLEGPNEAGPHTATVHVECEVKANITNSGHAKVDMKTGYFYFKVPEVKYGWSVWLNRALIPGLRT